MMRSLDWTRDGADWPNRHASRFVTAGGLTWHVQRFGSGPVALLVHGTGASTHSWRDFAPLLAQHFTVVAFDLPGHAFTSAPASSKGYSLPGMTDALAALLAALDVNPVLAIGHSAGAAILARMCIDGRIAPRRLICLNGALLPLHGMRGRFFSPAAKLFAGNDLAPLFFAWRASDRAVVERLLASIGSPLDSAGVDFYARLARNPGHVAAALRMMANWDLIQLARDLPQISHSLVLVAGSRDSAISPTAMRRTGERVPGAPLLWLADAGHLAHEERPAEVAALVATAGATHPLDAAACVVRPPTSL
jgi:magnesium chelatase accessory protein